MGSPTNPLLSWTEVIGALGYNVQLSTDPGFVTNVVNLLGHPTNSYQVSGLRLTPSIGGALQLRANREKVPSVRIRLLRG
jgi:hypothetical protein